MKRLRITICLAVALLAMVTTAQAADFVLTGNQLLDVTTSYTNGYLYEFSTANVLSSGSIVNDLYAYNSSTVNMSGGSTYRFLANDSSTVDMSGGSIYNFYPNGNSTVKISGGSITRWLDVYESSIVNISGGSISGFYASGSSTINISGGSFSGDIYNEAGYANDSSILNISGGTFHSYLNAMGSSIMFISGGSISEIFARDNSTVIFDGYNFGLGDGLSWGVDGETILGTGLLTGKWFDNTSFVIPIGRRIGDTTTIMAVPEPATLFLLTLGGLFLRRRNHK